SSIRDMGMVVRYDQPDSGFPMANRPVANGCGNVMPRSIRHRTSLFSVFCAQVAALLESDQANSAMSQGQTPGKTPNGGNGARPTEDQGRKDWPGVVPSHEFRPRERRTDSLRRWL